MLEYYTIAVIALLGVISPGPDFFVVVKNSLSHDRNSGIYTSLGITAGLLVHSAYCLLGLALVISKSVWLFNTIKYLGAAYLIYLGLKSLFEKASGSNPLNKRFEHSSITVFQAFRDGFLANVLNPKCTLFMLAVFTMVVKPNTPMYVQYIYALEIILIATVWFIFLSCILNHNKVKSKITRVQHIVSKVIGVVLIALGLSIMFKA